MTVFLKPDRIVPVISTEGMDYPLSTWVSWSRFVGQFAAFLRRIPVSDHAAKFFSTLIESCSCCWACGEVVNSAQPVVHLPIGRVAA